MYTIHSRSGSAAFTASALSTCSWSSATSTRAPEPRSSRSSSSAGPAGSSPTVTARAATAPASATSHSGAVLDWMATRSPARGPSASRPWAARSTKSRYAAHVVSCQIPSDFSRSATPCGSRCARSRIRRGDGRRRPGSSLHPPPAGRRPPAGSPATPCSSPRYARITFGSRWISAGAPIATGVAEVEHEHAVGEVHDEPHVVLHEHDRDRPAPRGCRGSRAPCPRSRRTFIPATGSSMSSSFGSIARARPSSTRFLTP